MSRESDERMERLLTAARTGDREAFETLAEEHRLRLKVFVERRLRLHLGPEMDHSDLLQETFTRAFESISRFESRGADSFFQWLAGIAKHVAWKHARRATYREAKHLASTPDGEGHPVAPEDSPSLALQREERFERLESALDSLKPEYREVVYLSRIEGLKVREVAERLGRSHDSVKHMLARALLELRQRFGETESFHLPDRSLLERETGASDEGADHGGDHDES